MKKLLLLALLMFAPMPAAAAAPVSPQDQAAIRTFLDRLYLTYSEDDIRRSWNRTIGAKNVFTPDTNALLDENTRLLKGEEGAVGTDVFCACNDYGKSFRLVSVAFRPLPLHRVNALVTISNFGRRTLNIEFEKTPKGWRVYNVELPKQGMLRAVVARENAEIKREGH